MNTAVQVCSNCGTALAMGLRLHFCPYCGTPQLERKLLASKTTQNYDPSNPQHKPWRDNPHLPKRNYTYGSSKSKQPWCPPMRQPRPRIAKSNKGKVQTQVGDDEKKASTLSELPDNEDEAQAATNITEENNVEQTSAVGREEEDDVKESFTQFYTEATWPIAVYDAEHWMAVSGMSVNLSLTEQTLGRSSHCYWLRVGVMFDEDRAPSEPENSMEQTGDEQSSPADDHRDESSLAGSPPMSPSAKAASTTAVEAEKLYTLAVLSSDVAKWMVPHMDDWVELSAVDPLEYYMARHMERILQSIAHRVVTTNLNEQAMRQCYAVELRRKTKMSKFESTAEVVSGLPVEAIEKFVKNTSTSTAAWGYNANQVICRDVNVSPARSPGAVVGAQERHGGKDYKGTGSSQQKPELLMSRTDTSLSVCFLDWVVELSHLLTLTRGISVRRCPSMVRLAFRYADRLVDPLEFQNSTGGVSTLDLTSLAEKEAAAAAQGDRYVDPRFVARQQRMERFAASQKVTHVVLYVCPVGCSLEEVVPTAELVFDLPSLQLLLQKHAPLSWDDVLADGKKSVLLKLTKRLANLLRLEYTNEGIKYSIIGTFSEPAYVSCAWPHDAPEYLVDDIEEDIPEPVSTVAFTPLRYDSPIPIDPLNLPDFPEDTVGGVGWSEAPSVEPTEPSTPAALTAQNSFAKIDTSAKLSPRPLKRRPCPFHPTLATCACVRKPVTLNGSDLWVYASAVENVAHLRTSMASAVDEDAEVVQVRVDTDIQGVLRLPCAVHCANELRLRAIDQTDESLHCDAHVSFTLLSSLFHEACAASGSHTAGQMPSFSEKAGDTVSYPLSSHNTIDVDLTKHPVLLEDVVTFLFGTKHVDLFLSRKNRLMKLVIK